MALTWQKWRTCVTARPPDLSSLSSCFEGLRRPPDVFTSDTATLFSELFAFSFDLRPVTLYSKLCGFDCCTQHTKWHLYRRKCYSWQPNSWFSQTQATNSHLNQHINITQSVHFRLPVVDGLRKNNKFHWAESIKLFKTNEESLFYSCLTDIQ